jgi:hypothetical protein
LFETIILLVLGAVVVTLSYVLFIPIAVHFSLIIDENTSAILSVKAFPFRRQLYHRTSGAIETAKSEKTEKERSPDEKSQSARKKKYDLSVLNSSDIRLMIDVIRQALVMVGRILRAPDYYIVANLAGGAAEPDITGELYGAYNAIRPNLPAAIKLTYSPDFLDRRFSGNMSCELVVTIFRILKEIVIFIFRLPKIKVVKLYRKLKKGRKYA